MSDIATRIRDHLAEVEHEDWCDAQVHTGCCPGKGCGCFLQSRNAALRAVLDQCDKISRTYRGEPYYPGMVFAHEFRDVMAKALGISDSPTATGVPPVAVGDLDWRSIAGRIYLDNGGFNQLTDAERDAAEKAAGEEAERRWGVNYERANLDASDRGEQ